MTAEKQSLAVQRPTVGSLFREQGTRQMLRAFLNADDKALDRYIAVAYQTIVKSPQLMKCEPMSVIMAVKDAAALKLDIDGVLGQAYVVPYAQKAQMQLGYRGVIALALRSGTVQHIDADVVWRWDGFTVRKGSTPRIDIEPKPPPADATFGMEDIVGAYAVAHLRGDATKMVWLWNADLLRARERSQAYRNALNYNRTDSPWQQHAGPMSAKTAVNRLGKQLELSPQDLRALILDEARAEGNREAVEQIGGTSAGVDLEAVLGLEDPQAAPNGPSGEGAVEVKAQDPAGGATLQRPPDAPGEKKKSGHDTKADMWPEES